LSQSALSFIVQTRKINGLLGHFKGPAGNRPLDAH
jgi:hypothetical protein